MDALTKDEMALLATSNITLDASTLGRTLPRLDASTLGRTLNRLDDETLGRTLPRLDDETLGRTLPRLDASTLGRTLPRLDDETYLFLGKYKVPVVRGLYGKIVAVWGEGACLLKQATYGPDDEEEAAECGSQRCIGGWTVHFGGALGWALKEQFGFAVAALLIHTVSCPGLPAPRYDVYPNEWAVAIVEKYAAAKQAQVAA